MQGTFLVLPLGAPGSPPASLASPDFGVLPPPWGGAVQAMPTPPPAQSSLMSEVLTALVPVVVPMLVEALKPPDHEATGYVESVDDYPREEPPPYRWTDLESGAPIWVDRRLFVTSLQEVEGGGTFIAGQHQLPGGAWSGVEYEVRESPQEIYAQLGGAPSTEEQTPPPGPVPVPPPVDFVRPDMAAPGTQDAANEDAPANPGDQDDPS